MTSRYHTGQQARDAPASNASNQRIGPSTTPEADEVAAAATSAVAVPLSAGALRAAGRRTRSMGARRGNSDRVYSSLVGTFMRPPRSLDNRVYQFQQDWDYPAFHTTSTMAMATFGAYFTLANLRQSTSLAAVFDQYRITKVELWLIPRGSAGEEVANPGLTFTVVDYDDDTPLASTDAAEEYTNVLVGPGLLTHYRSFKPHAAVAAYSGAFTSYLNVESPWIDCGSPSVRHYGFKVVSTITSAAIVYDLLARLHVEFRHVH